MTERLQPLPWQKLVLAVPDECDLLLSGGRGGGKSTAVVQLIVRDAVRFGAGYVGALVRKDLAGLRKLERELLDQIEITPELKDSKYLSAAKEFRFNTGGILYLHYIKDEASFGRFQGLDLSHVYIDEVAQIADPGPVLRLKSSMRSTTPGVVPRLVMTANPNNIGSWWIYQHVISRLSAWRPGYCEMFRKEVVYVPSTLFDNPHIVDRDAYIESLKASCNFDDARIQSEVYGNWATVSGAFFGPVWDVERIKVMDLGGLPLTDRSYNPHNLWLTLDWGTRSPSSLILAYRPRQPILWGRKQIGANSVILLDEHYTDLRTPDGQRQWNIGDRRTTTATIARAAFLLAERNRIELRDVSRKHRLMDAAMAAEIGSTEGSLGNQLAQQGVSFIAAPKVRRIPGWALVSRMLEAAGDPTAAGLYATPRCESFWATLPVLVHDELHSGDLDTTGPDHTADAIRYLLTATVDRTYNYVTGALDGTEGRPLFRVW
ncbi:phage terminase large subunit [Synechococcus sp. 1G10]|uniref:phage terminase large subunit n=1 Tax=Synechococcus sp. 1G10 TaxID=2025605 RepID=UPI001180A6E7|nr:phage terminase large subunit [Synechococcus sp. 1G10]